MRTATLPNTSKSFNCLKDIKPTPPAHIEKSCTSAFYSDRKLGVSEVIATAASTIDFFTGNNIGPKSDLASRSLEYQARVGLL